MFTFFRSIQKKTHPILRAHETITSLWKLQRIILDTLNFTDVVQNIADSVLSELNYYELGYKIIVLALLDEEKGVLKRVSISRTKEAKEALEKSPVPFSDINIPLSAPENLLIKAVLENKSAVTHNMADLLCPPLLRADVERIQKEIGIITSTVYPLVVKEKPIGVLIFSLDKKESEILESERELIGGFVNFVGIAVQNAALFTSLDEAKKSLEKANERLKELDRMKDEFVSVASHELRTPMTAIKSYLWMALAGKGGDLTEKQRYYVQRGYNSVDRLIRLVNDMLNVSRIDSGRITLDLQAISLDKLTSEVVEEVLPRAQELGVHVVLQPVTSLLPVLADPDKIKEVLFNLIGNSLKFTPQDGTITVSFQQKDSYIQTTVQDTGTGMDAEDIPKLFQKFGMIAGSYVANRPIQGTGLGLYICRSIIELHHGKIWASSEGKGKGSQFIFTLPVFSEDEFNRQIQLSGNSQAEHTEIIHNDL